MAEQRKEISELSDGIYEGVLKRIFKNDLKQKPGYFLNMVISINDEEYRYGQYVSEKNLFILYQNILLPLGMYCSEQGVIDCLKIRDLYVRFEKKSDERYTNIIFKPMFEVNENAPVGSKNTCIINDSSINNEDESMDDIPY